MSPISFCIRSFELGVDQTIVLDTWRASELRVEAGTAWATVENEPHDLILRTGDRLAIGHAPVRLQGLESSRVALVHRDAGRAARLRTLLFRVRDGIARAVRRLQLGAITDDARS